MKVDILQHVRKQNLERSVRLYKVFADVFENNLLLFSNGYRNELEFRYECIAEAIELKRIEVESLMKSFESKVKQKEVN